MVTPPANDTEFILSVKISRSCPAAASRSMQSNHLQKQLDRYLGIPLCFLLGGFRRRASPARVAPNNILVIQLSALGDTILAVPTLRAIRHRFPDAQLTMLASPVNLDYLAHCPDIDARVAFGGGITYKLLSTLRRERYDCAIDLEHWPRLSALLAYASGAPMRIGFSAAGQHRHFLFTEVVPHTPGRHEVLNFLELAHLLECPPQGTHLEVWLSDAERKWVRDTLQREVGARCQRALIVLHPEAGRRGEPRRRWPLERYVQLADALVARYDAQIVLTGAPDEVEVSQQIAATTKQPPVMLAGKTRINQLAALFSQADLVISGNCGPMHLAAATGTPVIALHGPTNSAQWGPWATNATVLHAQGFSCSPCLNLGFEYACKALPDGTSPCMHTIAVSEVLRACETYLQFDKFSVDMHLPKRLS